MINKGAQFEKTSLRGRALIETIFDKLKNLSQIEHTRHRSVSNFIRNKFIEIPVGFLAYFEDGQYEVKGEGGLGRAQSGAAIWIAY